MNQRQGVKRRPFNRKGNSVSDFGFRQWSTCPAVVYTELSGPEASEFVPEVYCSLLLTLPLEAESLVDPEFPAEGEEGHDDGDTAI